MSSDTVTVDVLTARYIGVGIAMACTTVIAGVLLQYVRRFKGINTYLRSQFTYLKEKNALAIVLAILYYVILVTPVILMIVWVILLGVSFGVTPAIPVLLYSLFIFTLFIPTRSSFFYYKILALFILFMAAQIVTMGLAWDKTKSSTFFCLSAVLLIINGIFTSVSLWLMDGSCWSLPWALPLQLKQEVMKNFEIWKQQNKPPNIISGGLYFEICTRKATRVILIVVMYVLAFLTLMTYTLVVYFHTDLGPLGLINSICVISTDIIIFMLIQITKDTQTDPLLNSASSIMVRICLIAFAGNYWFIGYCLLYILLMFYITLLVVNKHYPTFEKIPGVSVQKINIFKMPEVPALILTAMFGGLIYYLGTDIGQVAIPIRQVLISNTTYPFWAIGVASILLSISVFFYMLTLRIVQRAQQKIRSITKYYLGLEFLSEYYTFLILSYAALVILGIYLSVQVNNALIWVSCVFLPLFYQSFVIFYANWTQNDFLLFGDVVAYNKKLKKRIQRQKMIQQRKTSVIKQMQKQGGGGDGMDPMRETKLNLMQGAEVQSNIIIGKNQKQQYKDWRDQTNIINALKENLMLPTDKSIIISIPMMIVSLAAFCIAYWFIQYDHTAFNIAAELVFLFLTLIPMRRYFSTLEVPHFSHIIMFVCGIVVNYAYGVLSLVLQWNKSQVWTLFWAIINVFILSCYATFALLRDKGISKPTIIVTVVNVLLSFGIGIITLAAWTKIIEGIVLLGVAFYYTYTIIVIYVYLYRNRSLPWILLPISIVLVVCTCFAVMVYSFAEPTFDNFYGFSITYLVINLIILLYAAQNLYRDLIDRYDRPNFFSPHIYPNFKYDPQIKTVQDNSKMIIFWLAGWLMFYFYTILMQIFIVDVNIGISASQIFLLVSFLTYMYFSTYNTYKAGKQAAFISPEILKTSWEQLLKLKEQLGVIAPSIDDINAKLNKYKQAGEQAGKGTVKVNPIKVQEQSMNRIGQVKKEVASQVKKPQQDIDLTIQDLENKLQKAIEDEKIELINYWITVIFKIGVIKKKKMLRFTTFIRQSGDFLATIGVNIVLDNELYGHQSVYQSALLQYNALSALQKIKFDREFKEWKIRKDQTDKKNQQLNNKHLDSQKKRQEDLIKKLIVDDVDDSNQPIEKMRDSPLKLKKIKETMQGPFSDSSFKASNDIIPPNTRGDVKGWRRPGPQTVVLKEGYSSMSVRQGYIGDCYLISAIGVLGRQHLQKILGLGEWENPNGAYMVKFRKYNKDIHVIIDSEFPVDSANKWLFGRCQDANQLFCNILEKAYAKLYGGYQNIVGGKVSIALADMTGGFPQQIRLKQYQQKNTNQIFDKMIEFKKSGYLMGAGSPENAQGDAVDIDGIVQGHAYLVLDVRDLDGNKLIKVRNPHGNQGLQSTLDWSDDSPKWNKRLLNLIGEQLKEDGAFWLSLDDFVYVFRSLYVTRIFNPEIWKTEGPIKGQWKGKTAAGLPTKKNPQAKIGNNPQYGIKVSKKSTIFIQLSQNELDATRRGKNYIFFMVQKTDGQRIQTFSMNKLVGKSGSPINSTSISAQIMLDASSYPYTFTLMTSCMDEGSEGTYNLSFYCDDKSMQIIPNEAFNI